MTILVHYVLFSSILIQPEKAVACFEENITRIRTDFEALGRKLFITGYE